MMFRKSIIKMEKGFILSFASLWNIWNVWALRLTQKNIFLYLFVFLNLFQGSNLKITKKIVFQWITTQQLFLQFLETPNQKHVSKP